ncbi:MAG: hypothetical protein EU544_06440 [Promethearchaeota archaeon]|nr:MAG: hypothetical protein EU544_06440 [Candidatus Lokiarchaeota archaeon]
MLKNKPFCFLAVWEPDRGVRIIESFPRGLIEDLTMIATNIFMAYHYFHKKEGEEIPSERAFFTLELENIQKRARVLLDTMEPKVV